MLRPTGWWVAVAPVDLQRRMVSVCEMFKRRVRTDFVIDAVAGNTNYLLKVVSGKISDDAYCALTQLDGFRSPNDEVSVIQIARAVEEAQFPSEDSYEYAYAINSCRQNDLRRLDSYLLFAVSAIFLDCNKREPLGAPHESEFFRNMIATSAAINEGAIVDVCVRFIREISFSLNEQSSRQECFSGVALAFALEVHGIAATENDRHATDLARKKMKGAHAYDLTLTPEELDWWRDLGNRLENASARRTRLLDMVPVS